MKLKSIVSIHSNDDDDGEKKYIGVEYNDSGGKSTLRRLETTIQCKREKINVIISNNVAILSERTHTLLYRSAHAKSGASIGLEVFLYFIAVIHSTFNSANNR